jgi:hypothetical protein
MSSLMFQGDNNLLPLFKYGPEAVRPIKCIIIIIFSRVNANFIFSWNYY